nr:hypothetical protein [Tanacetum cinerariifolium]
MANLTFADSHNMVAYLEKSVANADFAEIDNFLMLTLSGDRRRSGRAATTAASLDAEQDNGTINRTQSTIIPNELIPQGTGSGGSPRINTLGSGEDNMQLMELIELCTKLSARVLALKNNKTTRDLEITHIKKRVKSKKSKEKLKERGLTEKSSETATRPTRGMIMREASETTTRPIVPPQQKLDPKDKAVRLQAKLDEEERQRITKTKTKLKQEQEILGFKAAVRLQAELDEEKRQRIVRRFTLKELNVEAVQTKYLIIDQEIYTEGTRKYWKIIKVGNHIETGESSKLAKELRDKDADELSQEEILQMMIIVSKQGMNVEALQTKYLIIDQEIYTEGTRKYWKIIKVGNHIEVHHLFDDMLKAFYRDDLVMLWSLVKEKLNSIEPKDDKEREIWVELKRLFKPDTDD